MPRMNASLRFIPDVPTRYGTDEILSERLTTCYTTAPLWTVDPAPQCRR
jgi:hypothetical protein